MEQYSVTGMSCAACQARVEKAVAAVPGVTECAVSLLTNSMGVEGTADSGEIIKAIENAGYGARLKGKEKAESKDDADALADKETPLLKKRLAASIGFLVVLMYFSMGHMMLNLPLPAFFDGNHVAVGLVQLILAGIIMVINQRFFTSGFKALVHRSPNMDTLVALGSSASYIWSTYALFAMTAAQVKGDAEAVMMYMDEFYFESAAMILTLITVGKMLEARSKGKTTDALKSLMKLAPKTAFIEKDGVETEIPVEEIAEGDVFVVRPGDNVPADGVITWGSSSVNESALTGESIPVDKTVSDKVFAATINTSGFIKARATGVGQNTALAQIIKMVSDAAATKAPIAKIADKVSGIFVPTVIGIAVLTMIIWLAIGSGAGYALSRAIAVLVISCPCALGLATPVAIMVGSGVGAKNGILFKTAAALEETGRTKIIALDKTGTVTKGEPVVTDIVPAAGMSEGELLELAAALESKSEHPLAKAVVKEAGKRNVKAVEVTDFKALPGNGLSAIFDGTKASAGKRDFIEASAEIGSEMLLRSEELAEQGKTSMFFECGGKIAGLIAVADEIKPDSAAAIKDLKCMGLKVVMITGDSEKTANAIGELAGVDEVIAGVLPEGKEAKIRELAAESKVAMVGDGINDAPALTRANTGIAIGAGTDVAIDAADVVLMNSSLKDAAAAIRLSRATLRNIHENLFWAFIYNIIGIPLAAGAFVQAFGWSLNPMFGAAAMSLSSFCVVSNALRLNLFDIHKSKVNNISKSTEKSTEIERKEDNMEFKMNIEGMMCGHCEASVKKALEAVEGVSEAVVSHETGTALVSATEGVTAETLKKAVEDKDYKVVSVE